MVKFITLSGRVLVGLTFIQLVKTITNTLWKPKTDCRIHKSSQLVPIFSQLNPIHAIIRFKIYAFFRVIPRRLNCICQRFGTLFHLHRRVGIKKSIFKIDFTLASFLLRPRLPGGYFPSALPIKTLYAPFLSPTVAICFIISFLTRFTTIFEECKS